MNATSHGTVIRVEYSPESLGDMNENEFVARMFDAIKDRWPGALVNIAQSINNRYWGMIDDENEIPTEDIRQISEDVFSAMCAGR